MLEQYFDLYKMEAGVDEAGRGCYAGPVFAAAVILPKDFYHPLLNDSKKLSEKQLKSDDAIELKNKDLSKRLPHVPISSDQMLFETSTIKEKLSNQLTKIIKETSFDCSIYPHGKEKIACMNFADPTSSKFSYIPDYSKQQSDNTLRTNKRTFEWTGKSITINGVEYVYRKINKNLLNIYDLASYKEALENPGVNPIQIGTYEINDNGTEVFKQIVN
jgi:ribonuclease HII